MIYLPRSKSGKIVNCDECGKEAYCPPSKLKRNRHNFCSMKCSRKWIKEHLRGRNSPIWQGNEVNCDYCGKKIMIQPFRLKTYPHHFCSRECFGKWYSENAPRGKDSPVWSSIKMECDYCGEEICVKLSRLNMYSRHFCSMKCFGKWKSEGYKGRQNPNWKEVNRNKICEICGKTFVVYRPSYVDKQRFCSIKCQNIAHSTKMENKWKDLDFRRKQGELIVKGLKRRPTKPEKAIIDIIKVQWRWISRYNYKWFRS